jgi:broad specificity phosphatase PhoE
MKKIVIVAVFFFNFSSFWAQNTTKATTVYLIRHAEKELTNKNPHLSAKGLERAKHWATVFKNVEFDAINSTDYHRTLETANPVAKHKNMAAFTYKPKDLNLTDFAGKTVLIVGHSNTISQLINKLLGLEKYNSIIKNHCGY